MKDKLFRRIEDGMTTYEDVEAVRWRIGLWFMAGVLVGIALLAIRMSA